jgi:hypothetical protein
VNIVTFDPLLNVLKTNNMINPIYTKTAEKFTMVGDWAVQSKQLKEKFAQLTDEDLKFETGKENDLLQRVETRLNKKREEVITILKKEQPEKA